MKKYIADNSKWLSLYDSSNEINRINELDFISSFLNSGRVVRIADVGCGNGRSIKLMNRVFKTSTITAIDRIQENIDYIISNNPIDNVTCLCCDAFDFFAENSNPVFDIVLFSWSFFDMLHEEDKNIKTQLLEVFIANVKKHLSKDGRILILQPTKGGVFERILSLFLPSSDSEYLYTHTFLLNHGFIGPQSICPEEDDKLAIWSSFNCCDMMDLYNGIASVVFLETGDNLSYKCFSERINEFIVENNNVFPNLTDCVNIYYSC